MGAEGKQNTAMAVQGAGTIISLHSENKQSKIRQKESIRQSSLLNLTADEIMRRFEMNKISAKNQSRKDVGTAVAGMGSSGGSINNQMLIDMMTEADQSIEVMRQEATHDAWVKREEAAAYERQSANEATARKKHTMGTILGTAGMVAGTVYGGPAGGAAGGSAGYAAGSAIG